MRYLANWCILAVLSSSPCAIAACTLNNHAPFPSVLLSAFQQPPRTTSIFTRFRDLLIRSIWSVHCDEAVQASRQKVVSPDSSNPPSTVLARYGGDIVLRFNISSDEEATALSDAVNILFLDVPSLLGLLPQSLHHAHTPLLHDLAQAIFASYPSLAFDDPLARVQESPRPFCPVLQTPENTDNTNIFFRDYQPLSVIVPWMRLLRSLFPTHVRMINIGVSYEGRYIPALRVGVHPTNSDKPSSPRKTIIIAGGSHAREWISTSSVNYVAYSFITAYGKSREMTRLLEEFDWVFIPTLNPDGYVYTWENDRLWRKNRQQTSLRFCKGVDLDHSYGFEWDHDTQSANNPCSESFAGEAPFEGIEARRFANWVRNETENNNVNVVAFVDLHSYSQQILYPYSYTCTSAPPSLEDLEELAIGLAKAIRVTSGKEYGVTAACEGSITNHKQRFFPRMELGGGSPLDWFYHEMKVKYSYQIKLRDTGSYGFLLPSKNIVPTGNEVFSAIKYIGNFLLGNKGFESGEEENRKGEEIRQQAPSRAERTEMDDLRIEADGTEGAEEEWEMDFELRRRRRR
ncbi:MAG: hypothetical protein Q9170_000942 [Blastenia crenularia]